MRNNPGQDIDRPHYYSQYWLDVAEGKQSTQTIGGDVITEAPLARQQTATATPVDEAIEAEVADGVAAEVVAAEAEPITAAPPPLAATPPPITETPLPTPAAAPAAPAGEPARKPAKAEKEKKEPARVTSLSDLAHIQELMNSSAEMEDSAAPNLEAEDSEPDIITDFAIGDTVEAPEFAAEEEEDEFLEDEFEEDEEEDEWAGGGRRPRKPTKPPRRDRPARF